MSTAFVFPGQGSQYVGMGQEFLNEGFRDWFTTVCSETELPLDDLILEGPPEELEDTRFTQPAVFIINQMILEYLLEELDDEPEYFAGHSLGEYNALVAAGWASFDDLLPVVVTRGREMGAAADQVHGGMAALLKIDPEDAERVCSEVSGRAEVEGTVQVALYNSPGQVVISGTTSALKHAREAAKDAGALKAVELDVSGPWHSRYMQPAVDPLRTALEDIDWTRGEPVVTNVSARFLKSDPDEGLLSQLTKPVRWTDSIDRLLDEGVRTFVEVGPGDALKGMINRITRGMDEEVNVYNTDSIENTRSTIEAIQS